jgi:ParB-like chromosome segregation protein Spo0J
MALFSSKPKPSRGHVRVHASRSGHITGLEVKAALLPEEVQPALSEALRAAGPAWRAALEARLERHKRAVHKNASVLDRVRGRVLEREEAAEAVVPGEVFFATAGPVTLAVDGNLRFVELRLHEAQNLEEAAGHLPRALEAACKACEARWEEKILEHTESLAEPKDEKGA